MKLFILYQTDNWKSKASRVCFGVFDTRAKAIDSAKWQELYNHNSEVVVLEVTLNLFEEVQFFATKKAQSLRFGLQYRLIQRSPQLELDYFLCFFIKILSTKDIKKLTIAPSVARIIVFSTSSECRFGKTLKNVPPAVPITVELL